MTDLVAEARYCTLPTPGAIHGLRAFKITGRALGRTWLPWQLQVNRVMTERHPADPRRYRYRLVVISVPRQSGKTDGLGGELVSRTLRERNHIAFYTAQTGKDARERHTDLVKRVTESPLQPFMRHVKRAGAEAIAWPNGSEIRAFAPTLDALHGYTPPTVMLDEAWAYSPALGQALFGAIIPAQQTLIGRQLVVVSTMGDSTSEWFHELVRLGRESVLDPDSPMAYFEWSADPESDLYDPANWLTFHPALGQLGDVTIESMREQAEKLPPATWARTFGNIRTRASVSIIPAALWLALADDGLKPIPGGVALAYDVAHDRSQASIVASWMTPAGPRSMVVYAAAGWRWLPAKLAEVAATVQPIAIGADDAEPTRDITETIRRERRLSRWETDDNGGVTTLTTREFVTACGALIGHVSSTPPTFGHDGDPRFADAVDAAVMRPLGDGMALSRRLSRGPIDALIAAAVSVRLVDHAPAPAPVPLIRTLKGVE